MSRTRAMGQVVVMAVAMVSGAACDSHPDQEAAEPIATVAGAVTLPAPTLMATAPSADTVKLLWTDVPGNTGVWFDRSTNGGTNFSAIQQLPAGSTSFDDGSRSADTSYCYRVRVVPASLAPTSNVACATTPVGLEAETATRTLSAGGTASVIANGAASGGQVLLVDVGSSGFVELSMNLPETGRYRVKTVFQTGPDRGRTQLSIDGADQGAAFDGYAAVGGITEVDLGDVDISKVGVSKKLRFRVTGKNAASTGFKVALDVVKLYNDGRRFEAEISNPTVSAGDSRAAVVDTAASAGKVDVSQLNAVGDFVKVTVPVTLPGDYLLTVRYKRGTDRGRFQTKLDGTNVGPVVDGFATSAGYVVTELGAVTIGSYGNHEVRFSVTGKNGAASSFGVSIDYVELRAAHGAQQLTGYLAGPKATAPLIGPVPAAAVLDLSLSLPVRNRPALDTFVRQISDPASPTFGQGLTPDQFTATHGPTAADYQAFLDWAQANGLTVVKTYPNRTLVDVQGTADAVNRALFVTLVNRRRPDGTPFFMVDREPSIGVTAPVLWIGGLDNFVLPKPGGGSGVFTNEGGAYLGNDFRRAYALCADHLTGAGQRVGILGLGGINVADVALYETTAGRNMHVPVNIVASGPPRTSDASLASLEVTLDTEMAIAMAPGLTEVVIFQGNGNPDSALAAMATRQPLANQLSASFEYDFSTGAQQQLVTLAAQNQTFFTSSGDDGAYSNTPTNNLATEPQTIVGGTALTMNGLGVSYASESIWNEPFNSDGSGGGIITFIPLPSYQQGISMATNGGSTTFRNAPDVSAVATNTEAFGLFSLNGAPASVGPWINTGTSIATPIWAGFMALANEQRQAAARRPLGFLNPTVYGISKVPAIYAATFNDIQDGTDNNTFHAVPGYDLAAGVGTPKCNLLYQLSAAAVTTPVPTTTLNVSGTMAIDRTFQDGHVESSVTPVSAVLHMSVASPQDHYDLVGDATLPAELFGFWRLGPNPVDVVLNSQGIELGSAGIGLPGGLIVPAGGTQTTGGGAEVSGLDPPLFSARATWSLTLQSSQP